MVRLAVECIDFGSLKRIIDLLKVNQKDNKKTTVPEIIMAKLSQQILGGLGYLHYVMDKMHRDINPDNVLVNFMRACETKRFWNKQILG